MSFVLKFRGTRRSVQIMTHFLRSSRSSLLAIGFASFCPTLSDIQILSAGGSPLIQAGINLSAGWNLLLNWIFWVFSGFFLNLFLQLFNWKHAVHLHGQTLLAKILSQSWSCLTECRSRCTLRYTDSILFGITNAESVRLGIGLNIKETNSANRPIHFLTTNNDDCFLLRSFFNGMSLCEARCITTLDADSLHFLNFLSHWD